MKTLNNQLVKRETNLPVLTSAAESLKQDLSCWKWSDEIPASATAMAVAALSQQWEPALRPAGAAFAMVQIRRLFSVLPAPIPIEGPDPLTEYVKALSNYPPDVLERAIDGVIRNHHWRNAPLIGDICNLCSIDPVYKERLDLQRRLGNLKTRMRQQDQAVERRAERLLWAPIEDNAPEPPSPQEIAARMVPRMPKEMTEIEAEADFKRRQARLNKQMKDAGIID